MAKIKTLAIVGTRPEAVKMAPVVLALREESKTFDCRVINTGQHRELTDQTLSHFRIRADADLDLMRHNQGLCDLTARLLPALDEMLVAERPDWVLAQGDTTTVLATALACYYRRVAFAHVEAGLRTGNKYFPFPEEMNRVVADRLADRHFAPTPRSRENLLAEGITPESVVVTGNTVIDALRRLPEEAVVPPRGVPDGARLILVTAHRRENFGRPLEEICEALLEITAKNEDVAVLYPVHPNPNVKETVERMLAGRPRITLCAPLDYPAFVGAMRAATLIASDSGGVQEEAPSLGKPVLVLRDETERPEAAEAGTVKLVGPHRERIVAETERLLSDRDAYEAMARATNPYGDGHAAARIRDSLAGRKVDPFGG